MEYKNEQGAPNEADNVVSPIPGSLASAQTWAARRHAALACAAGLAAVLLFGVIANVTFGRLPGGLDGDTLAASTSEASAAEPSANAAGPFPNEAGLLALHEEARRQFPSFYGGAAIDRTGENGELLIRLAGSSTTEDQSRFRRWIAVKHPSAEDSVTVSVSGYTESELDAAAGRLAKTEEVLDFSVDYGSGHIKVRREYLNQARATVGADAVTEWLDAPAFLDDSGNPLPFRQ